jgi:hypothetical protein
VPDQPTPEELREALIEAVLNVGYFDDLVGPIKVDRDSWKRIEETADAYRAALPDPDQQGRASRQELLDALHRGFHPDQPGERCPTCGSDDPAICKGYQSPLDHPHQGFGGTSACCPDPFHQPGDGRTWLLGRPPHQPQWLIIDAADAEAADGLDWEVVTVREVKAPEGERG